MHHQVRAFIYKHFREAGVAPTIADIADAFKLSTEAVVESLRVLAESHAIVLQSNGRDIWMAHPFSGIPTDYIAKSGGRTWFANCAWDAIAILSLVGNGQIEARDPLSGTTNVWSVTDGVVEPPGVVHFLVPAKHFWDDIGFT